MVSGFGKATGILSETVHGCFFPHRSPWPLLWQAADRERGRHKVHRKILTYFFDNREHTTKGSWRHQQGPSERCKTIHSKFCVVTVVAPLRGVMLRCLIEHEIMCLDRQMDQCKIMRTSSTKLCVWIDRWTNAKSCVPNSAPKRFAWFESWIENPFAEKLWLKVLFADLL
jgi:hypothetical protein